ncbi:exo-alpha-sialidase [Spirosoma sp. BT702]|uniref:Exo-alpha-sialidase n=1 Tax=Spirosoma profusum TaxID=2771354 RepID=A0A926XZE4_9BACT|nr:sialidase family protein [Spirosoma profusum]MBD2703135.1 exo-alpha-sialidase [Spirosoma profusum]
MLRCGLTDYVIPISNSPVAISSNAGQIVWDQKTLRKVSSGSNVRYSGYARLIQLHDQSLLAVYEASGSVVAVKSTDLGDSWSVPIPIAPRQDGINMAVPDVVELKDHSILVCYNPRPYKIDPSRRFSIRTKKSYDGGQSWQDERLLYEAGFEFSNGCWEPAAIQLPNGEIQLFFANEGIYQTSNEQNISLLRSTDNGLSWTNEPSIVSFRAGSRDGMPAPLLLRNGRDLVFAIEDNGFHNFKPYLIHSTIVQNWHQPVTGNSADRWYALAEPIPDTLYAGAPYLRQLPTGETLLSYQGTENRINRMANAEMKVVVGDSHARNFSQKSVPFSIPAGKSGLWNSLSILADSTIIALTSTNGYSGRGEVEVWMIKGRLMH